MFCRFLRRFWGCIPLSISVILQFAAHLVQKTTAQHLRYIPRLILTWLLIASIVTFAFWGLFKAMRALRRKDINIYSVPIVLASTFSILLCAAGAFYTAFVLQPEQVAEKYNMRMVACTYKFLSREVYYYEYINTIFYGQYLGVEHYGSFGNITSVPQTWQFYDLEGNLIDSHPPQIADKNDQSLLQEYEPIDIAFTAVSYKDDELVFSVTADEFITAYNSLYYMDCGNDYLTPIKEWLLLIYDSTPHSDYETYYYRFQKYGTWTEPTFSIYVPADRNYIQEITLNFDDHGYIDSMYVLFEEMCFYTLKVIFPDLDETEITQLYKTLIALAYDDNSLLPNEQGYENSQDPVRNVLYYKDGIGLYPCYSLGLVRICIIPVSEEIIADYEMNGVEIHEIL